ncbi:phosphoribosyl-ATP diphosphatase [Temperatibacter marinus]|uniref:Phosphoribosyl-ATP pyrophosphatase n=1 Tax=Temperatibacter marinus TaxID=1456591 RepID=A0AA52EIC4_9PROT|nr:phosphoribosyl-ATP diphosphatase [Temperatibacter marinus]WND03708.1 phosphoribosyl-ATP diphosphatase [Temperatibacter marinus]
MTEKTILEQLEILESLIQERRHANDPDTSYVAKMLNKGPKKIAQKVGEEATEVAIAAVAETKEDLENEAADLLFHLQLLLASKDSSLRAVTTILSQRMGISGLDEKNSRKAE